MKFKQMLSSFIGSEVEVMIPGELFTGELLSVSATQLTLKIAPVIYGPPEDRAVIAFRSIEFVRVLSA
ncbi:MULTISPECIES: hypothetical protein [Paenibacillus]|uniref:hypothetical protein n=1 Tax=Paenibacillus TaxID=44249 RepID=UPI0022B85E44|nr:hypothetical protein [Paenibacillus caseinilyticus]MCZ8520823.1 hypothetical protein [Paenibacillus caseinilyticus]